MRALLCLCLATDLLAGEPPQPGRDHIFLGRVLTNANGGSRPWKTFRMPEDTASAVVEVVGEFTPEELRQVTFQEFLAWFRMDLKRFWKTHNADHSEASWSAATLPVERFGGNPVPRNAPLGRVGF